MFMNQKTYLTTLSKLTYRANALPNQNLRGFFFFLEVNNVIPKFTGGKTLRAKIILTKKEQTWVIHATISRVSMNWYNTVYFHKDYCLESNKREESQNKPTGIAN